MSSLTTSLLCVLIAAFPGQAFAGKVSTSCTTPNLMAIDFNLSINNSTVYTFECHCQLDLSVLSVSHERAPVVPVRPSVALLIALLKRRTVVYRTLSCVEVSHDCNRCGTFVLARS